MIQCKRKVFLKDHPSTERWLDGLSKKGLQLESVSGHTFQFKENCREPMHHFLLSPEKGNNDSAWVCFEFIQEGAVRIPHSGFSFFCPVYILTVSDTLYQQKQDLFRYYFQYRNYRLCRRLAANASFGLGLGAVSICTGQSWMLTAGFMAIGAWNLLSLLLFQKDCGNAGLPASFKKPKRPGF